MVDAFTQLRSDAKDNRDRILKVARDVFASDGLGVSMREVARRAEVGPATLYRRFPTKKDLIMAAFLVEFRLCHNIVEEACADSDAWRGVCTVIERLSELNAQNQGFTEAFMAEFPGTVDLAKHRNDAIRGFIGLASRAQRQGRLRSDFVVDDLVLFLSANRGLSNISPAERIRAARRLAALMIDGLHAAPTNQHLPPPPRLILESSSATGAPG